MKNMLKRIISFILAISFFAFCSLSVCASDHGGGGSSSSTRTLIKAQESKENREKIEDFIQQYFKDVSGFFVYAASQVGCVFTGQYKDAYESWLTMEDIINETGLYVNENGTPVDLYISATLMTQIKQAIDDYAAENEPYIIVPTFKVSDIPASAFGFKNLYDSFLDYTSSHYFSVFWLTVGSFETGLIIGDVTPAIESGGGFIMRNKEKQNIISVDGNWQTSTFNYYYYLAKSTSTEVEEKETNSTFTDFTYYSPSFYDIIANRGIPFSTYYRPYIVTPDGGRIRVFNTLADFMNYSVGQRKIYYTSNYYNYVPDDLQVSIDDLQKTINDMQDVIDQLLDQITNDTSESEIEELLRLILEELKNNQGGGGGGGSGGGDLNVDIDLSGTNSILSKILAKVTQIFDKLQSAGSEGTGGGIVETVLAKMQESLDEIIKQLKSIKHWTIADTVVDAADAVADWAGLVLGVLEDAQSGAVAVVTSITSGLGSTAGMLKTKFPFCVPWDIFAVVSFLKAEPEAPHFKLPIVLERYGIESYIEIDMQPFQVISDICRTLLALLYAYGLMMLTPKVIDIGKEIL